MKKYIKKSNILLNIFIILLLIIILQCILYYIFYNKKENFIEIDTYSSKDDDIIIVSSHYNEDLKWIQESENKVVVCSKTKDNNLCHIVPNKGRETSAYLKFIIDNYYNLPKYMAFIHGHETAWHQKIEPYTNLLDYIKNCTKYKEYDYISLNNLFIDDRYEDTTKNMIELKKLWDILFKPYLNRDFPKHLLHDCCAQFIVSRERILRNSIDAYKYWFDYIMNNDPYDDKSQTIATLFEYIWHIIFGEPDIITLEEHKNMLKCELDNL